MVGVEDDRLALLELVLERAREPLVPTLSHPGRVLYGLGFLGVEVPVEVIGLEDPELEVVELDLVSPELSRSVVRHGRERRREGGRDHHESSRL